MQFIDLLYQNYVLGHSQNQARRGRLFSLFDNGTTSIVIMVDWHPPRAASPILTLSPGPARPDLVPGLPPPPFLTSPLVTGAVMARKAAALAIKSASAAAEAERKLGVAGVSLMMCRSSRLIRTEREEAKRAAAASQAMQVGEELEYFMDRTFHKFSKMQNLPHPVRNSGWPLSALM